MHGETVKSEILLCLILILNVTAVLTETKAADSISRMFSIFMAKSL